MSDYTHEFVDELLDVLRSVREENDKAVESGFISVLTWDTAARVEGLLLRAEQCDGT